MRRRDRTGGNAAKTQRPQTLKRRNALKTTRRRSFAASKRAFQAGRLPKRGHDFIYVAILVTALFALLALSVWFAAYAWTHIGGDPVPAYGYVAIAGGVVFSLVVGGGLMALVFYSSRHGYDDLSGGDN
jgi:hypothetical protein